MNDIVLAHFEAVIFDMDGVLIDSEPIWKIAMESVFHSVGCNLSRKDFQKTVGLRIDEVIEDLEVMEDILDMTENTDHSEEIDDSESNVDDT